MKILNKVIPILMHLYSLVSNLSFASRKKPHKAVPHPTKCDVINDVKLFPTVYRRIYCRKFLTLSNQTSRNKSKYIRIMIVRPNTRQTTYNNNSLSGHNLCLYLP